MTLLLRLLLSFCFDWEHISLKHSRQCFIGYPIIPRISPKILRCGRIFNSVLGCLDIPMKHCLSCWYSTSQSKLKLIWKRGRNCDFIKMSLKSFTYSTCQPVGKAENREFPVFHSGVIVKFSWLVGNVFGIVCHDIVNRRVIDCHVRDDPTEYVTEVFLWINTCWQTSNLFKRKILTMHI